VASGFRGFERELWWYAAYIVEPHMHLPSRGVGPAEMTVRYYWLRPSWYISCSFPSHPLVAVVYKPSVKSTVSSVHHWRRAFSGMVKLRAR
jgi:hypothetical protein